MYTQIIVLYAILTMTTRKIIFNLLSATQCLSLEKVNDSSVIELLLFFYNTQNKILWGEIAEKKINARQGAARKLIMEF